VNDGTTVSVCAVSVVRRGGKAGRSEGQLGGRHPAFRRIAPARLTESPESREGVGCSYLPALWRTGGLRHREPSLRVDTGLLLVVLVSIAIRRPFTLQYAREGTAREIWNTPAFIRTNYIITAVWALAFAVMVSADLAMLYLPNLPLKVGIGLTILAIVGAIRLPPGIPIIRGLSPRI